MNNWEQDVITEAGEDGDWKIFKQSYNNLIYTLQDSTLVTPQNPDHSAAQSVVSDNLLLKIISNQGFF